MATVGQLIVDLRASTASFASDLGKANQLAFNSSKEIERSFKIMGVALSAAFVSVSGAAVALVATSIDAEDKMGKLAQSTGFTVEQFSSLAYAAGLSDVSVDSLSTSLTILSKNLEKSNQQTLEGKAAQSALSTLFRGNIPVFKSTDDALLQIAERLSQLPDGFQKSALNAQIFGRGAKELIPFLNQGAAGIEALRKEAAEFGVVISTDTAKKAEAFNDNLKRLDAAVKGLGNRLAADLLPYLSNLADTLVDISKQTADSRSLIDALRGTVQVTATVILSLAYAFEIAASAVAEFLLGLKAVIVFNPTNLRSFNETMQEMKGSFIQSADALRILGQLIKGVWVPGVAAAFDMDAAVKHLLGTFKGLADDALTPAQKKIKEFIDNLREQIALFGKSPGFIAAYKVGLLGADDAQKQLAKDLADTNTEQIRAAKSYEEYTKALGKTPKPQDFRTTHDLNVAFPDIQAPQIPFAPLASDISGLQTGMAALNDDLQKEADQIKLDNVPATEKYREAVEHLKLVYESTTLSTKDYNAELRKLKTEQSAVGQIVLQVRQDTAEMFTQAIFRAGSFSEAMGNLLERIAEMIFQLTVMKPLLDSIFGAAGGGIGVGGLLGSLLGGIFGGGAGAAVGGGGNAALNAFLPHFAGGGYSSGGPMLVGENGPEIFWPGRAGTVQSNGDLGGSVTYNIDARGAQRGVSEEIIRAIKLSEDRAVTRSGLQIREDRARKSQY